MKRIRIIKIRDPFVSDPRGQPNAAARKMSDRTGFSIAPTETGFTVAGEWREKFESKYVFARRVARELQLASGVLFSSVLTGDSTDIATGYVLFSVAKRHKCCQLETLEKGAENSPHLC